MPRELPKRWPLGIDRIVELWQSNADGHLLAFLCSVAKDYEPQNMLYQNLLFGPRAFHVLHPTNVETVLSTRFNGMLCHTLHENALILHRNTLSIIVPCRLRIWCQGGCL